MAYVTGNIFSVAIFEDEALENLHG